MDILVIGAGVVGLAAGAALARRGADVIVVEAATAIGSGISSRNSEVVHGGMYYAPGSLRARHCVEGRRRLYAYCAARKVPIAKPGKLIVATTDSEVARLNAILSHGRTNGVEDLALIDGTSARALEPQLACVAALISPHTGIVDSHALMLALQGEIEDHGGAVALSTAVTRLARIDGRWSASFARTMAGWGVTQSRETQAGEVFEFDAVINAGGLSAQDIAHHTDGFPPDLIPRQVLAKGSYFAYSGRPAFHHLIYPVPVDGGLGVHVTLDLAGRMKFGPDVEWVDSLDYAVDLARADVFYPAIRRYFPALPDATLVPDYAGIRPKLTGPGEPAADFRIIGEADHGLPGLVALFGIESPGLTAALSLAEAVGDLLGMGH